MLRCCSSCPLVGSGRDFLQGLPATIEQLRESDELSRLGDSGAAGTSRQASEEIVAAVPDAISAVLGIAGDFFSAFSHWLHDHLHLHLLARRHGEHLKRALGAVLTPGEDERWLGVWEKVTTSVSRWAIGVVVIATIAGTTKLTALAPRFQLALALGVIAGLLDMIPNIGATIAGVSSSCRRCWAEEGLTAAIIMLVVLLVYQQVGTTSSHRRSRAWWSTSQGSSSSSPATLRPAGCSACSAP